MATVIVEVTARELPAVELAREGLGLAPGYPVIENTAATTNLDSEPRWRYEVPETALERHPDWKVVHG